MFVVPLSNDKIKIRGKDDLYLVSSYTGFKSEPSVYLKSILDDGTRSIFFSEILEINGILVEYQEDSNVFKAKGPLKRSIHLPQKGDKIFYNLVETDYKEEKVESEVLDLRLHSIRNKSHSLQVKVKDSLLSLTTILDIERKAGNDLFDRSRFQKLYLDYLES